MQKLLIVLPAVAVLVCSALAAKDPAKIATTRPATPAGPKRIVLLAGKDSHGKTAHAWTAGAKLLKHCLDTSSNVKGIHAEVRLGGWPKDPEVLDRADTIVLLSDGFAGHPLFAAKGRAERMSKLMRRGVGLVCIHYAVAPLPDSEADLLAWLGGIYKKGYSKNPINTVEVSPAAPKHPVCRGWKPYVVKDELYYRLWFGKAPKDVTPILTAMLPKNQPRRETVAWAVDRPDGGRGFGFTGAHYHSNWRIDGFRTMVLNAIVWTAKMPVPPGGVQSTLPDWDKPDTRRR